MTGADSTHTFNPEPSFAPPPQSTGGTAGLDLCGAVEDRIRTRASAAGCIALLSKPFKPVDLLDAVFRATQDSYPIP